jgi:arylsulfatase A-like enzyme
VAITMDWTATMLAAAGVAPASEYPLDGMDLGPQLSGRRPEFERTVFWRQPALRYNGAPPQAAVRRGRWKYLRVAERPYLFDLATDPGERSDKLAEQRRKGAELEQALARWTASLNS